MGGKLSMLFFNFTSARALNQKNTVMNKMRVELMKVWLSKLDLYKTSTSANASEITSADASTSTITDTIRAFDIITVGR